MPDQPLHKMKIIYIRTSTEKQEAKNQLEDCETLLDNKDYILFEEKQSAWKDLDREKFEEIKSLIKKGGVTDLYCWDWDRLFRNRIKFMQFFELCKLYDCKIHSFRQQYFEDFYKIPSPYDEIVSNIVLNLMGHQAEEESKKKSDRVKLAVRRKEGKPTKSYKGNVWGRKSLTKKTKEEIMKLHEQGLSIREIADSVFYWDKNNNHKQVSRSAVHKTITEVTTNHP